MIELLDIPFLIYNHTKCGHNPNNQDDNENYIELRLDHRKWNDRSCDHVAMFVCEKISIRVLHQQPITEPYMQVHVKKIFPVVFYQFEENQFKIGDV